MYTHIECTSLYDLNNDSRLSVSCALEPFEMCMVEAGGWRGLKRGRR
jgi:hypothetical protein